MSPNLKPILEAELANGNDISSITENGWGGNPLSVSMKNYLRTSLTEKLDMTNVESYYRSPQPPHYGGCSGWRCKQTGHVIVG